MSTARRGTAIGLPYAASRLVGVGRPTLLAAIGAGGLYTCCTLLLAGMALTIRLLEPLTDNQRLDTI